MLKALATSNVAGRLRLSSEIFDKFPNRTLGLILTDQAPQPFEGGRAVQSALGPEDHT